MIIKPIHLKEFVIAIIKYLNIILLFFLYVYFDAKKHKTFDEFDLKTSGVSIL